jgi:hypothetical protein
MGLVRPAVETGAALGVGVGGYFLGAKVLLPMGESDAQFEKVLEKAQNEAGTHTFDIHDHVANHAFREHWLGGLTAVGLLLLYGVVRTAIAGARRG